MACELQSQGSVDLPPLPARGRREAPDALASRVRVVVVEGGKALSPREEQILGLLATGVGTKEIAQQLDISWSTVRLHLKHIYHKLHVHGREEAVARYRNSLHPSS